MSNATGIASWQLEQQAELDGLQLSSRRTENPQASDNKRTIGDNEPSAVPQLPDITPLPGVDRDIFEEYC